MKNSGKNNWIRLLAGFYLTFESASSGGAEIIEDHLDQVITRLRKVINQPEFQTREPHILPVCQYLKNALKMGEYYVESPIYQTIGSLKDYLTWEYGYYDEDMPQDLKKKYAFSEIVGPKGPFMCKNLRMGMVLMAPGCYYPTHRHPGIHELYVCLGGTVCINKDVVLSANSLAYNVPNAPHQMSTDASFPVLLGYSWIGSQKDLENPVMKLDYNGSFL